MSQEFFLFSGKDKGEAKSYISEKLNLLERAL